jgi:C-terminal processing protease CtpA/Prc
MISSNSSLIGTKVLSRFKVLIDWKNQELRISENNTNRSDLKTFGFRMGYSDEKKIHVHSVIKDSPAFKNGIRPNMQILKIDALSFSDDPDFCVLLDYYENIGDTLSIQVQETNGEVKNLRLEKTSLVK